MDSKDSKYRNKLSPFRKAKDTMSKYLSDIRRSSEEQIKEIDAQHAISDRARNSIDSARNFAKENELDIAGKNLSKAAVETTKWGYSLAKKGALEFDQKSGVTRTLGKVAKTIDKSIIDPTKESIRKTNISSNASRIKNRLQSEYGEVRAGLKTYRSPGNIEEQLVLTRGELVKITACILQMNTDEAESWLGSFGRLISAKTTGIVASGALLGLVSTFGTAGTGTAIASLSGAASASATLAWVGGWVGGGMAAGAILTAGIGVLAGIAAFKFMGSKVRQYDDLSATDRALVETVGMLVAAIDDALSIKPINYSKTEAESLVSETLIPLYEEMIENTDDICSRLDLSHSLKFREHLLWDFEPAVIDGFKKIKPTLPIDIEATIGGVIYALLTRTALDGSFEQQLVMDALRRSKTDFEDASESAISDYLSTLSPVGLQGFANNVKGITHELLFVHKYNAENTTSFARVMEETNFPGYDVEIVDTKTGDVLGRFQLKAVSDRDSVDTHYEKYPDTSALATEETASKYDDIQSSGILNAELTKNTDAVMENVADNTIFDRSIESAEIVGLVALGKEAISVLQGRTGATLAVKNALSSSTQAAAATGITAYLFS